MKKKAENDLYIKFWRNKISLTLTTPQGTISRYSFYLKKSEQQKNLTWRLGNFKLRANLPDNFLLNLIFDGELDSTRIDLIYNQLLSWNFIIVFVQLADKKFPYTMNVVLKVNELNSGKVVI